MVKENLFEDMGAEEMRERLQKVSEYADSVIEKARGVAKLYNDDVTEYKAWNTAHDVLAIIIHCSVSENTEATGDVECSEVDELALLEWDNWLQQTHEEIKRDRATLEHNQKIMELQQKRLSMDLTRASLNVSRYNEWRKKQGLDEAVTPW